jgi:hypothetical protein
LAKAPFLQTNPQNRNTRPIHFPVEVRMRIRASVIWITLVALVWCTPAWAASSAQHIATPQDLQQAIADRAAADQANRTAVTQALERDDARALAARMGLNIKDAQQAVQQMSSDQLARAAEAARAAQAADLDQAGGSTTIVISLTTLLLIIIVVLLIAK